MAEDRPRHDLDEEALELAAFRYRIIAEVLEAEPGELTAAVRTVAQGEYTAPDGSLCRPDVRTIWRWVQAYRRDGLLGLCRKPRSDRGHVRALEPALIERASALRREGKKKKRATATIIDILQRQRDPAKHPEPLKIARSTLDRIFSWLGLSRRQLRVQGKRPFTRIETDAPFELVVVDFHHGPFVRVGPHDKPARALLCAFIDHYSRYVPEARYYLHEDFVALRFGFRRLLTAFGLMVKLYVDGGSCFKANRFLSACSQLGIQLLRSKPYAAESRGVIERFNGTVKDQFESEVWEREELLSLDELNAYWQAWLGERYHRDIHSETGQAPLERFRDNAVVRPAPEPDLLDELLRLPTRRTVQRKSCTVEVLGIRYSVDPTLRGRKVGVLYDPFALEYVLITHNRKVVQRAFPQRAGESFPEPPADQTTSQRTDYLELLRRDHERRSQSELAALRLAPAPRASELSLPDLEKLLESCRGACLSRDEKTAAASFWRKMRPIPTDAANDATKAALRRQGSRLHLSIYLDAIAAHLIRLRTKKGTRP